MARQTNEELEAAQILASHLKYLRNGSSGQDDIHEGTTTPIFTMPVLRSIENKSPKHSARLIPQYGLLAGMTEILSVIDQDHCNPVSIGHDPRVFFNMAAPSSTFICGSQGSGKSHTLSCLLENFLLPSEVSTLPRPLTGLVFHYDAFISDDGGSPCEAAYLSSNSSIKVRVLCSPTNIETIKASFTSARYHVNRF